MQAVDTTIESLTADGFGTEYVGQRSVGVGCSEVLTWIVCRAVFVAFVGVSRGCAVSFGLLHPTFSTWKGRTLYLEVRRCHGRVFGGLLEAPPH